MAQDNAEYTRPSDSSYTRRSNSYLGLDSNLSSLSIENETVLSEDSDVSLSKYLDAKSFIDNVKQSITTSELSLLQSSRRSLNGTLLKRKMGRDGDMSFGGSHLPRVLEPTERSTTGLSSPPTKMNLMQSCEGIKSESFTQQPVTGTEGSRPLKLNDRHSTQSIKTPEGVNYTSTLNSKLYSSKESPDEEKSHKSISETKLTSSAPHPEKGNTCEVKDLESPVFTCSQPTLFGGKDIESMINSQRQKLLNISNVLPDNSPKGIFNQLNTSGSVVKSFRISPGDKENVSVCITAVNSSQKVLHSPVKKAVDIAHIKQETQQDYKTDEHKFCCPEPPRPRKSSSSIILNKKSFRNQSSSGRKSRVSDYTVYGLSYDSISDISEIPLDKGTKPNALIYHSTPKHLVLQKHTLSQSSINVPSQKKDSDKKIQVSNTLFGTSSELMSLKKTPNELSTSYSYQQVPPVSRSTTIKSSFNNKLVPVDDSPSIRNHSKSIRSSINVPLQKNVSDKKIQVSNTLFGTSSELMSLRKTPNELSTSYSYQQVPPVSRSTTIKSSFNNKLVPVDDSPSIRNHSKSIRSSINVPSQKKVSDKKIQVSNTLFGTSSELMSLRKTPNELSTSYSYQQVPPVSRSTTIKSSFNNKLVPVDDSPSIRNHSKSIRSFSSTSSNKLYTSSSHGNLASNEESSTFKCMPSKSFSSDWTSDPSTTAPTQSKRKYVNFKDSSTHIVSASSHSTLDQSESNLTEFRPSYRTEERSLVLKRPSAGIEATVSQEETLQEASKQMSELSIRSPRLFVFSQPDKTSRRMISTNKKKKKTPALTHDKRFMINNRPYVPPQKTYGKWVHRELIAFIFSKVKESNNEIDCSSITDKIIRHLCATVSAVSRLTNQQDIDASTLVIRSLLAKYEICSNALEYCVFVFRFMPFTFQSKVLSSGRIAKSCLSSAIIFESEEI